MKRFAASVQHITGQGLEVLAESDSESMTVVELELEELRSKVEELSDEVRPSTCSLCFSMFTNSIANPASR